MGKIIYIHTNLICLTSNPQTLFTILLCRQMPKCEVWVFESVDEAITFTIQHNNWIGFSNPNGNGALKIPRGEFCMLNPAVPTTLPMTPTSDGGYVYNINTGIVQAPCVGYWSVDAINGYAVVRNLDGLMHYLLDAGFLYPHAVWIDGGTVEQAQNIAFSHYIRRFYTRYDGQNEMIALPEDSKTLIYQDPHFYEREQRYQPGSAMQVLREHGLF